MRYKMKLVVVGDAGVGKTALLFAFTLGSAPVSYVPTVFDTLSKGMTVDGYTVDVGLWDTAGQEDYDRLRPLAYPLADVFLVCFSLVRHQSLMSCQEKWMPELRRFSLDVPVILVGNKCDMRADEGSACTHIPWQDGHKMARQLGCVAYYETSAMTQSSLQQVFTNAVRAGLYFLLRNESIGCFPWKRMRSTSRGGMSITLQRPSPPLPSDISPRLYVIVTPSTYEIDLKQMISNPLCADVEFHVASEIFSAHRIILCASSMIFAKMFGVQLELHGLDDCSKVAPSFLTVTKRLRHQYPAVDVITCSSEVKPVVFLRVLEYIYIGCFQLESINAKLLDEVESLGETLHISQLVRYCRYLRSENQGRAFRITTAVRESFSDVLQSRFVNRVALADTWFVVNGVEIPAHAPLLVGRCDVMAAMLTRNGFLESKTRRVSIKETSIESFLALLEYLYTDRARLGKTDPIDLLALADRFCLPRLVSLCELHIAKEVETLMRRTDYDFNIIGLLLTAQFYHATQLRMWCLNMIANKFETLKTKPEFTLVEGDNLVYIEEHKFPPQAFLDEEREYRIATKALSGDRTGKRCSVM